MSESGVEFLDEIGLVLSICVLTFDGVNHGFRVHATPVTVA